MIDTCTGAWSSPAGIRDWPILIVTGKAADGAPPLPCPAASGAAFETVATRPTEATVPGTVVVPSGMVTSTGSPGWTTGPPAGSETETPGVSVVPDSTTAPGEAGVPSCAGVAETRSGPGRKVTSPSGITPVTVRPCACC